MIPHEWMAIVPHSWGIFIGHSWGMMVPHSWGMTAHFYTIVIRSYTERYKPSHKDRKTTLCHLGRG